MFVTFFYISLVLVERLLAIFILVDILNTRGLLTINLHYGISSLTTNYSYNVEISQ